MAAGFNVNAVAQEQSLETVVVTATGQEQNIADAPASISVISGDELEKQGYNTIADAVANIPGVLVTNGGNAQDISIRGQGAAYTLYLVDGKPISAGRSVNTNGSDGGKQIGLPPLSMIERIEVIRGPMSSLYGSDAIGGVINVITKKKYSEWHGTANIDFIKSLNDISNDGKSTSGYLAGPLVDGLLGLRANYAYTGHDESTFIGGGDGAESRPKTHRSQGGVEFILTPTKDDVIKFSVQDSKQINDHTKGVSTTSNSSKQKFKKTIYTLGHEATVSGIKLNSYIQQDISDRVGNDVKKEKVTSLNTQASFLLTDKHFVTLGASYKSENFNDQTNRYKDIYPGAVDVVNRWTGALFGEFDWSLTEKLTMTTGLRYDNDERYGSHFSPRIYGVYKKSDTLTLKGGVSTGYKQPDIASSTLGFARSTGGGAAVIMGNPNLKPEESINYEISAAFASLDNKTKASLTVYHTEFKNKIQENRLCQSVDLDGNKVIDDSEKVCVIGAQKYSFISEQVNVSSAEMQGLELTLDQYLLETLSLATSYTYTRTKQKSGADYGKPLNKQPMNMLNIQLNWQATPKANIWTQANYRGKTSDYAGRNGLVGGTPGYALMDLGVNYQLNKKTSLRASIKNLTDRKVTNSTYGVVLDGRRLDLGMTLDF